MTTSTEMVPTKKNRPGQFKKRLDWDAIRNAYIEGLPKPKAKESDPDEKEWLTLADVAEKFGAYPGTVRKKSMEERWPEQRQAYQVRLAASRRQKRILALSKEATDMDTRVMSSAKLGITMVQTRLGEIARDVQMQNLRRQEAERRVAAGLAADPSDFGSAIDARELNTLGQAAQQFHSLARAALGEDVVKHEVSGVDGGPIEIDVEHNGIKEEMQTDPNGDRLLAVMDAMERAGLIDNENIIDGDVEEDEDEDAEGVPS